MKLSLANFPLEFFYDVDKDQFQMLKDIRDCGYTCTDYNIIMQYLDDRMEERAKELKAHLEALGMEAPQAHAPVLNPLNPPEGVDVYEALAKCLKFCQIAGIPYVVIHSICQKDNTKEEFMQMNIEFYRTLIPAMEETGVAILLENIGHYMDAYYLKDGAALRELIDALDHPMFGACWDVGHANLYRASDCSQYDSMIALGDKLKALHVHDNCSYFEPSHRHHRIDMHTMPFATQYCCVNYDGLLQGLKDINYQGTFNFEVMSATRSIRPSFTYNGEVVRTLEFFPIHLWKMAHTYLYEIGKYMLETYDLFEG